MEVAAMTSVSDLVKEDCTSVYAADGSADARDGDGNAHDADYSHVETTNDGVGVV